MADLYLSWMRRLQLWLAARPTRLPPAAPAPSVPAQPGEVVLGEDTRFVLEMGEDGLNVFYVLQRAVEMYARDNQNKYPTAGSIAELQPLVTQYLPPKFEVNTLYIEEVMSKPSGYLIVANVKDHKIVMSNLKT